MFLSAVISLEPATIAAWVAIGLVSGWFAGKVLEEPTYGIGGDLILGVIGAIVAALLYGFFKHDSGFWGSVILAGIGAWVSIVGGRTIIARFSE
jgi:uncharacterized membrane protein YeaQ/YmgE (transglycosylase-associated protein family)